MAHRIKLGGGPSLTARGYSAAILMNTLVCARGWEGVAGLRMSYRAATARERTSRRWRRKALREQSEMPHSGRCSSEATFDGSGTAHWLNRAHALMRAVFALRRTQS